MNLREHLVKLLTDPALPVEDIAEQFSSNPKAAADILASIPIAEYGGDFSRMLVLFRLLSSRAPMQEGEPVLLNLGDVTPRPVQWLWPDRIPLGKLTLLAGHPGHGKSLLTLDIAARLSTGATWPLTDSVAGPADTILIAAEDDPQDTIAPRLDAAKANRKRIHVLTSVHQKSRDKGFTIMDIDALDKAIRKTTARLVVIDPISSYLGATNTWHDTELRSILEPLMKLAARRGVAILSVIHLRKGSMGGPLERISGSVAFGAAARVAWLLAKDPGPDDSRRLFLPVKSNIAPLATGLGFRIEEQHLEWCAEPVTMTAAEALDLTSTRAAEDFLQQELRDGPVPAESILTSARSAGIDRKDVISARATLGVDARKIESTWWWALPEPPVQVSHDEQQLDTASMEEAFPELQDPGVPF